MVSTSASGAVGSVAVSTAWRSRSAMPEPGQPRRAAHRAVPHLSPSPSSGVFGVGLAGRGSGLAVALPPRGDLGAPASFAVFWRTARSGRRGYGLAAAGCQRGTWTCSVPWSGWYSLLHQSANVASITSRRAPLAGLGNLIKALIGTRTNPPHWPPARRGCRRCHRSRHGRGPEGREGAQVGLGDLGGEGGLAAGLVP